MRWFCQTFPSIDKRVCLSEVLTFLHLPTVIVFRFEKASAKKNLLRKVTKCRGNSVFLPRVSGDNANQISPSKFGILLLNSIKYTLWEEVALGQKKVIGERNIFQ